MNSQIFFIIGVGGVGKSTLVSNIKDKLSNIYVYDFDEVGVPANVDEKWRYQTTNYWLGKAQEHYNKGEIMVLGGFLVPSEVENQVNFNPNIRINYGLLEASPQIIRQRLIKRGWSENKITYHLEWANRIKKEIEEQENHFIVSSDKNNPQEVVAIFEKWIKEN